MLIIDDEPEVRESIAHMLKGHRVVTAADGHEGMQVCKREKPDLVVLDIVMPRKEGMETIIDMRKTWPTLPILAMSGGWREYHQDYLNDALALGANKVMVKPFVPDEFRKVVAELLR